MSAQLKKNCLFGWLFRFYDISTFVGYLMPDLFLYKWTVLFPTIQFSISMQFSPIWPIDRILSGATTQSGPGSDGNEQMLRMPQGFSITGTSSSECLESYQDTCWLGVLLFCRGGVGVFYSPSRLGKVYFSSDNKHTSLQ